MVALSPNQKLMILSGKDALIARIEHVKLTGDIHAAVVLGRLIFSYSYFLEKHGKDSFYKTNEELKNECMASSSQLRRIKTILNTLPFLTIKKKGIPAKNWYTFNADAYYKSLEKLVDDHSTSGAETDTSSSVENNTTGSDENNTTITENTKENTSENTKEKVSSTSKQPKNPEIKKVTFGKGKKGDNIGKSKLSIMKGKGNYSVMQSYTEFAEVANEYTTEELIEEFETLEYTNARVSDFWRKCMRINYHEELKLIPSLSGVNKKRLWRVMATIEADHYKTLGILIKDWVSFTEHCEVKFSAFKSPHTPMLAYLDKYIDAIPSFSGDTIPTASKGHTGKTSSWEDDD